MPTFNHDVAAHLAELGALLRAARGDRYRVRAYERELLAWARARAKRERCG